MVGHDEPTHNQTTLGVLPIPQMLEHQRRISGPHVPDGRVSAEDASRSLDGRPDDHLPDDGGQDERKHSHGPLGIAIHHPTFLHRRRSSVLSRKNSSLRRRRQSGPALQRVGTKTWWKFRLRDWDDDDEQDWWFASTAIPLLAATLGPLANVFSIAALVTHWRMCLVPGVTEDGAAACVWDGNLTDLNTDLLGIAFTDPTWCDSLNAVSLVAGFVGNFFLLFNFTNRIRYIIALPVTIIMWYIATAILISITVAMEVYDPPYRPQQIYSQGYWYAVMAACLYMICAMLLMVNMLGYFLGHYPQHFALTESQQTLILQTMLFFVWLAGGAAVFDEIEQLYGTGDIVWGYANTLYFCDVTILTVGFGDLYPTNNIGRGFIFPYAVGGIIMLGLMVSSIAKFASELGSEKVIHRHIEHSRARTVGRTVTTSLEMEHRRALREGERPVISAPMAPVDFAKMREINFADDMNTEKPGADHSRLEPMPALKRVATIVRGNRKPKLILLREEKDRFDAMRRIQHNTSRFKAWYGLCASLLAFGLLWAGGAEIFHLAEHETQGMTYFEGLYFCYVCLLTIGYGDLAPKSNAGRPFFVFWSLIAVPTMTILVSDLGDTVIDKFKSGTNGLADFTIMPKKGIWREILNKNQWILDWLQQRKEKKRSRKRLEEGFPVGPVEPPVTPFTIDELAHNEPTEQELAKRLSNMIRKVASQVKDEPNKKYSYEEWVEFTRLIRFTSSKTDDQDAIEEEEGLVEWDWIGEDSPMMARAGEAEFILDRLCESMNRYIKRVTSDGHTTMGPSIPDNGDGTGQSLHRKGYNPDEDDDLGPLDVRTSERQDFQGGSSSPGSSSTRDGALDMEKG